MSQYLHLIATWMQLDVKELCNPLLKLYQKMEHIHALHHKLSHNMQMKCLPQRLLFATPTHVMTLIPFKPTYRSTLNIHFH